MAWLADVAAEVPFGVKTTEAPHYRRVKQQRRESANERRDGILAGDGFAFVSHVSDLYPSGFLPQSAGNVCEGDVVDFYRNAPLFEALLDRERLTGKCGACPYRAVCGGSRSRAYAYTGEPLPSDPLCAYEPPEYDGPEPVQEFG